MPNKFSILLITQNMTRNNDNNKRLNGNKDIYKKGKFFTIDEIFKDCCY